MTDLASRATSRETGGGLGEAGTRNTGSRNTGILGLYTAVVVAVGAAAVGLVLLMALVLVAWGADSGTHISALTALRAGGQAWLLAHHSPLGTKSGTIGLVPIGLIALPAGLLARAGILLGRANAPVAPLEAARLVLAMAASYGVIAALVSFGTGVAPARVGSLSAVLGAVVVALLAGGVGVLYGAELTRPVLARLPAGTVAVLRATGVAVAVLLAAGAFLVAASLAVHSGQTVRLAHALGGGIVGSVLVLLLGLLYAPNAVICAVSYLVGPGFAVGTGTSVSLVGAHLGPVPAFPLLAALPSGTSPAPETWPLVAAPLLAGVLAGVMAGRAAGVSGRRAAVRLAGWTGLAVGVALAVLAGLAGGPLGAGRLAAVGPSPWQLGGAAGIEVAVLAALTALVVTRGQLQLVPEPIVVTLPEQADSGSDADAEPDPEPEAEDQTEPEQEDVAESEPEQQDVAESGPRAEAVAEPETEDVAESDDDAAEPAQDVTKEPESPEPQEDQPEADDEADPADSTGLPAS